MGLNFCQSDKIQDRLFLIAITYAPILIFVLKVLRGRVLACFHTITFVCVTYVVGYEIYHRFSETSKISLAVGTGFCILYLVVALYHVTMFTIQRCRLCCLGKQYILSGPNHVRSDQGVHPVNSSVLGALVIKKPGATSVNGTLVPGLKEVVIRGRKLVRGGNVFIKKFSTQAQKK